MRVLNYYMGKKPVYMDICNAPEKIKSVVDGQFMIIPLSHNYILVCNEHQPAGKPRGINKINRIITVPKIVDGFITGVRQKPISGNFFICSYSNGEMKDLHDGRIKEIIALCGM